MSLRETISLEPTPSEVSRLNSWLDQKFIESGIEKTLAFDIKLCLNEVMANLISYGFQNTPHPAALIEISFEPGCANAVVVDNGGYFDILTWPLPKDRDLLNDPPGGFGIGLIRERATELRYGRRGDLNRLEIVCRSSP